MALKLGYEIYNEGMNGRGGMWMIKKADTWYTLGQTNYIALQSLMRLGDHL